MNEWINECPRLFLSLIRIAKSSQINKIKTDKRSSFTRVPSILDDGMFVNSMRSETIYGVFCFKWKTWENIFLHWICKRNPPQHHCSIHRLHCCWPSSYQCLIVLYMQESILRLIYSIFVLLFLNWNGQKKSPCFLFFFFVEF